MFKNQISGEQWGSRSGFTYHCSCNSLIQFLHHKFTSHQANSQGSSPLKPFLIQSSNKQQAYYYSTSGIGQSINLRGELYKLPSQCVVTCVIEEIRGMCDKLSAGLFSISSFLFISLVAGCSPPSNMILHKRGGQGRINNC